VDLGNKITSISYYAFNGCSALSEVSFPSTITQISDYAFAGCKGIKTIKTKADVYANAFEGCTSLSSVTLQEGSSYIGINCFKGCTSLKSITIPESMKFIESYAFVNCSSLEKVSIPSTVESLGMCTFGFDEIGGLLMVNTRFTIESYRYTAAEAYALEYGLVFEALDMESPGSIARDNVNKIIYLAAVKVSPTYFSNYLKSTGSCETCSVVKADGSAIPNGKFMGTGCKITMDGKVYTLVIRGDTDGDGSITTSDYMQIKKNFLKTYEFDKYSFLAADVDSNEKVDTTDYMRIKLHFLGEINLFEF
jgi:hypothetical protein